MDHMVHTHTYGIILTLRRANYIRCQLRPGQLHFWGYVKYIPDYWVEFVPSKFLWIGQKSHDFFHVISGESEDNFYFDAYADYYHWLDELCHSNWTDERLRRLH